MYWIVQRFMEMRNASHLVLNAWSATTDTRVLSGVLPGNTPPWVLQRVLWATGILQVWSRVWEGRLSKSGRGCCDGWSEGWGTMALTLTCPVSLFSKPPNLTQVVGLKGWKPNIKNLIYNKRANHISHLIGVRKSVQNLNLWKFGHWSCGKSL